jgi:hypothetical protein
MQAQPNQVLTDGERQLQRLIVLQLLRDDHDEDWSRRELTLKLLHVGAPALAAALASLDDVGVIHSHVESVWASRAARRLDQLELICV